MSFPLKTSVILSFILISIACNVKKGGSAGQNTLAKDTISFQDCPEVMKLYTGQMVVLKLQATAGTGYQWLVKEASPLLKLQGTGELEFTPVENKENMTGRAGYQILRFKAVEKGKGLIQLEYRRTFEATVEKTCSFQVIIE